MPQQPGKPFQEPHKRQIVSICSKTLVRLWRGFLRVISRLIGSAKQKRSEPLLSRLRRRGNRRKSFQRVSRRVRQNGSSVWHSTNKWSPSASKGSLNPVLAT